MTVNADWTWWTYFLVDGAVVTRRQIVDYDLASRSITYLKRNANDPKLNPHKIGTPEFDSWLWDLKTGRFAALWVDPGQSLTLSVDDHHRLEQGLKPEAFIDLDGQDPRDYFTDEFHSMSSYLTPELQELLRKPKPGETAG